MNLIDIQIKAIDEGSFYFTRWNLKSIVVESVPLRIQEDNREREDERDRSDELRERDYYEQLELMPDSRYPDRYGWDQYDR